MLQLLLPNSKPPRQKVTCLSAPPPRRLTIICSGYSTSLNPPPPRVEWEARTPTLRTTSFSAQPLPILKSQLSQRFGSAPPGSWSASCRVLFLFHLVSRWPCCRVLFLYPPGIPVATLPACFCVPTIILNVKMACSAPDPTLFLNVKLACSVSVSTIILIF
jgi:hypothetical protein